jgi:Ca2+-binding RTX toxin-like protein
MNKITLDMAMFAEVRSKITQAMIDNINKSPTLVQQLIAYNNGISLGTTLPFGNTASIDGTPEEKKGTKAIFEGGTARVYLDLNEPWAKGEAKYWTDEKPSVHYIDPEGEFVATLAHELGHIVNHTNDSAMEKSLNTKDPGFLSSLTALNLYEEGEAIYNNWIVRKEVLANGGIDPGVRTNSYYVVQTIYAVAAANPNMTGEQQKVAIAGRVGSMYGNQIVSGTNQKYWDFYYDRNLKKYPDIKPAPGSDTVELTDSDQDGHYEKISVRRVDGTTEITVDRDGKIDIQDPETTINIADGVVAVVNGSSYSVNAGREGLNFESDELNDGTLFLTTIKTVANFTKIDLLTTGGATSAITIEKNADDSVRQTVNEVAGDGSTFSEISQKSATGESINDWVKTVDVNGTVSVVSKTAELTTVNISDILKNSESGEFRSDGTQHVEWTSAYGTHGSKDVYADGNVKENVFLHMQGVDLWGANLLIHMRTGGTIPYSEDIHYTVVTHPDGTRTETIVSTVTGGFVKSGGNTVYDNSAISGSFWLQQPSKETAGVLVVPIGDKRVIFNYTYDPAAKSISTSTVNIDISGHATLDQTLTGTTGATLLNNEDALYESGGNRVWPSLDYEWNFYTGKFKELIPTITVPDDDGKVTLPDFAPPLESDKSGTLPDNQQNVHLTGYGDLTVTANDLDNLIVANAGNSTLIAGAGNSTLVGGDGGKTTFVTGSGNTTIIGGAGGTHIQFATGSGDLSIGHTLHDDTLQFMGGIASSDLIATAVIQPDGSSDYVLEIPTGQTITLHAGAQTLGNFMFADGSTTTLSQLLLSSDSAAVSATSSESITLPGNIVKMTLTGNQSITAHANGLDDIIIANDAGNTLIAGLGNNTLVAGKGNDILIGNGSMSNAGRTTFVHSSDAGHTVIVNSSDNDVLQYGAGTSFDDVLKVVSRDASGNSMISYLSNSGGAVDIRGDSYGVHGPEHLKFADGSEGSVWDLDPAITADAPLAIFQEADGRLNVQVLSPSGTNINLGHTAANVTGSAGADQFYAGDAYTTLIGGGGADQFYSGRGDAEFIGGIGGATFVISDDSGNIKISKSNSSDLLVFNGGMSSEGFSAKAVIQADHTAIYQISTPNHEIVTIVPNNGELVSAIQFGMFGEFSTLSKLLVATDPGATMSSSTAFFVPPGVVNMTLTGDAPLIVHGNELDNVIVANEGDDTLFAGTGSTTLVAGHGNNMLIGNHGSTTYRYDLGDGKATVLNSASNERIVFGQGISASDIHTVETHTADGEKIVSLSLLAGGTVELHGDAQGDMAQNLAFADGSELSLEFLDKVAIAGPGTDTLVAGKGNDTLIGTASLNQHGQTTFVYKQGAGHATITDSVATDILQFGDGVFASDLWKVHSHDVAGNDIYTLLTAGGMQVTIQQESGNLPFLDSIKFADGSVTTLSALNTDVEATGAVDVSADAYGVNVQALDGDVNVTGSSGDEYFIAGSGNATFIGNGGWDLFESGAGNATFVGGENSSYHIEPGSGNVLILSSGDNAELIFDQGIGVDKLSAHTVQGENGVVEYVIAVQGQGTVTLTSDEGHTLPRIGIVGVDGSYDYSVTLGDLLLR